jgi:hypothetical protein
VVRAAHAAAQLVQLRQAELVGAVHDDGVRVGTSMPVSMMVVHSRMLKRWATKSRMTFPGRARASGRAPRRCAPRQQFGQHGQAVLDGFHLVVQ